jgi:hypothetical protein
MSSGLECDFYEPVEGRWFYVLQDYDCPVGAWDWREYATAYGPFPTQDAAMQHLDRYHANPGGFNVIDHASYREDAVLTGLFERAEQPRKETWGSLRRRGW